jgi:hypothetical protein
MAVLELRDGDWPARPAWTGVARAASRQDLDEAGLRAAPSAARRGAATAAAAGCRARAAWDRGSAVAAAPDAAAASAAAMTERPFPDQGGSPPVEQPEGAVAGRRESVLAAAACSSPQGSVSPLAAPDVLAPFRRREAGLRAAAKRRVFERPEAPAWGAREQARDLPGANRRRWAAEWVSPRAGAGSAKQERRDSRPAFPALAPGSLRLRPARVRMEAPASRPGLPARWRPVPLHPVPRTAGPWCVASRHRSSPRRPRLRKRESRKGGAA